MHTVDFMKASLSRLVFSEIKVEGVDATLAQTRDILLWGQSAHLDGRAVNVIVGMKHAWEYLFHHLDEPLSNELMCQYNELIGYGGTFTAPGQIRGDGTAIVWDWYAPPSSDQTLDEILDSVFDMYEDPSEIACALVLEIAKAQPFYNGNKRTAQMMANHYLAQADAKKAFMLDNESVRTYFLESLYDYYTDNFSLESFVSVLKVSAIEDQPEEEEQDMHLGIIESTSPLGSEEAAAVLANYFCDVYGYQIDNCDEDSKWIAYLWEKTVWIDAINEAGLDENVQALYGDEWDENRELFDAAIDLDDRLFACGDTSGFSDEPIALDMYNPDPDNICTIFVYGD